MHLIDGFIDSIFVSFSLKSIVLDVVDSLKEKDTPAVVGKLVLY